MPRNSSQHEAVQAGELSNGFSRRQHMNKRIVGFHQDEEQHWVAELECGHGQHVRHDPPWTNRSWVQTADGRAKVLGAFLNCLKCDRDERLDDDLPLA